MKMARVEAEPASPHQVRTGTAPLLCVDHVSKEYDTDGSRVFALNDISLQVGAGEFIALMGRSGCGKSTLLNLAGAMDFPSTGRVLLDDIATSGLTETQLTGLRRAKVGFIFQSFQLIHTLSVIENVEVPLLLAGHRDPRPSALARLESVGLADYANRMPYQLSGGQMQRVAIARALVHSPRLLLADEPTGNLDTTTGNSILALLRRVVDEQGATILMATHSAEATSYANTTVKMRDGHVEQVVRS